MYDPRDNLAHSCALRAMRERKMVGAKSEMSQSVGIVFTDSGTWFGRLIRWTTDSHANHVFIEFPIWGQRFAGESTVSGTRIVPIHEAKHNVVAEFECAFPVKKGLLDLAERLGSPYDRAGTFFLGMLIIIGRWFRLKFNRLRWSTKAIKCSELVWYFLDSSGTEIGKVASCENTTPDDIMRYCLARAHEFKRLK